MGEEEAARHAAAIGESVRHEALELAVAVRRAKSHRRKLAKKETEARARVHSQQLTTAGCRALVHQKLLLILEKAQRKHGATSLERASS